MMHDYKPTHLAHSRRLFLAGLGASTICGCTMRRRKAERQVVQLGWVDPDRHKELALSPNAPYVIEPPDSLVIRVRPDSFGAIPLESVVQADGTINLTFAGRIYVAGMPLDEAESVIADHLTQYARNQKMKLEDPVEVNITVDESKSKYFYVLGKGVQQAKFPVTGRDTVLEAVLTAQVKSNAILEKIYVVRPHPRGLPDQVLAVDWLGIRDRGDTTTNYQLFPGDRVVIPGGPEPGLIETLIGSR